MTEDLNTPPGDDARIEWTTEEERELARLPKEIEPGRLLQERVVRSMREQGLVTAPARSGAARASVPAARVWRTAAAAGIVMFLGGVVVGQWLGMRAAADAVVAARATEASTLALALQEIGTAYATRLGELADLRIEAEGDASDVVQGTEVGYATLLAATSELARLDPDNGRIQQAVELLRPLVLEADRSGDEVPLKVFWF